MTLTVLAFDPGVSPSAAVYRGDAAFVLFPPMGVERGIDRRRLTDHGYEMQATKTHTPDIPAIIEVFRSWLPDICVIETVGAMSMPTVDGGRKAQGLASTASLMHAAGMLEGMAYGVAMSCTMRVVKLRPKTWRSAWLMPPGKEQSRLTATRLFPSRSADFRFKYSHNVADPLLMAMFIWHRETNTPLPK